MLSSSQQLVYMYTLYINAADHQTLAHVLLHYLRHPWSPMSQRTLANTVVHDRKGLHLATVCQGCRMVYVTYRDLALAITQTTITSQCTRLNPYILTSYIHTSMYACRLTYLRIFSRHQKQQESMQRRALATRPVFPFSFLLM